jgi:uncharacterized protein YoxC
MHLTENETTLLIWIIGVLLTVISIVLIRAANALIGMAKDVNEIKSFTKILMEKHNHLEKRVDHIENKIFNFR